MTSGAPILEIDGLAKTFPGLPPLRIRRLRVAAGDRVAIAGLDHGLAEAFVHLVTGAALPDEGEVRVAGRSTREIATDVEWLRSLDRFGIVTERAVLLEQLPVLANLALPLTVTIEPVPAPVAARVRRLAVEAGLDAEGLARAASTLSPEARLRVHLARALAVAPSLLLLEHPTARLDRAAAAALGATLRRVAGARGLAWLALTDDERFVRAAGGRRRRLDPEAGVFEPAGFWRRVWPRAAAAPEE